jgi:ABC-type antimicrobial peptide transport system permease subunit
MRPEFILKYAVLNFWSHRMRAVLTVAAVSIGVAAIIFLVSLGFGLEQLVTQQVVNFEAFSIIDVPSANLKTISIGDGIINRIKSVAHVSEVESAVNFAGRSKIEGTDNSAEVVVNSASEKYYDYSGLTTTSGKMPQGDDEVAVSSDYAKLVNVEEGSLLGKKISLESIVPEEYLAENVVVDPDQKTAVRPGEYKIVGIVSSQNTPTIILNLQATRKLGVINYTSLKVKADSTNSDAIAIIRKSIENIGLSTEYVGDTINQIAQVFSVFRLILGLFGMIALAVAAIGTFNTLTVSLLERLREIGLLKALGMTSPDIYKLFIAESLFISSVGAAIGILVGSGIGQMINAALSIMAERAHADNVEIFVTPILFGIGTAIFSALVGFITGWYPARRAVRTDALDALRYE